MLNKKGYTLIEVIIALTLTIPIVYGVITVPTTIMKEYNDLQELTSTINDSNVIRAALTTDIQGGKVEAIDDNTLAIGEKIYRFSESGLQRDNHGNVSKLSDEEYFYDLLLDDKLLHIYKYNDAGDKVFNWKYAVASSFDRGELSD